MSKAVTQLDLEKICWHVKLMNMTSSYQESNNCSNEIRCFNIFSLFETTFQHFPMFSVVVLFHQKNKKIATKLLASIHLRENISLL